MFLTPNLRLKSHLMLPCCDRATGTMVLRPGITVLVLNLIFKLTQASFLNKQKLSYSFPLTQQPLFRRGCLMNIDTSFYLAITSLVLMRSVVPVTLMV